MDQATPANPQQGQRMLAAIVFTDVVGFSMLAGLNESKAVQHLERDTKLVREISQQYGALLVKGTGDGMLMCFNSAVGALQAAIDIQEAIRKQNETLSQGDMLHHRIGVHLGDVILLPNDVIGDGVNVASRLQHEAKPGGIAISEALYAVVRGKLPFRATNLGPRNLKHIVETVNVWMIPPSDEPIAEVKPVESLAGYELEARGDQSPSGMRLALIGIGILACIAGILLFVSLINSTNSRTRLANHKASSSAKPATSAGSQPNGRADEAANLASDPPIKKHDSPQVSDTPQVEPPASDEVSRLTANYEFDTAADMLDRSGDRGRQVTRIARLRRLGEYRRWLEGGISNATHGQPIMVRGSGEASDRDYELWTADGGMVVRLQDGTVKPIVLRDMEPRELLRVTAAIFKKENASANERANIGARSRDFAIEMRLGKLPAGFE